MSIKSFISPKKLLELPKTNFWLCPCSICAPSEL